LAHAVNTGNLVSNQVSGFAAAQDYPASNSAAHIICAGWHLGR